MFDRLNLLIDSNKLKDKCVCVIGLGGVGGYVVEALVRSNIGSLIIVDYDKVEESNINRQIISDTNVIGKYKVDLFEERIKRINPNCNVIKINDYYSEEIKDRIFDKKIDFLVDACDSIKAKESLIINSLERDIPFITSMGTGNRLSPSKLLVTTLDKTLYDPIAKILRKWARDERINMKKIKVLTSLEMPIKTNNRTPGSNAFVPPSAGLLIASKVVEYLIEK